MRILKISFNLILTLLSFLIPKSDKYVLVGGWYGKRYADNSRGIYEYLNRHKDELGLEKVFWYTKDRMIYDSLKGKGLDVLIGYTPKAVFYHLRSRTHMIDQCTHDILGFLSVRCRRINLWHGFPLKKIGNLITGNEKESGFIDKIASGGFWVDKYVLTTSDLATDLYSRVMGVNKKRCIIASYPRTDCLFSEQARTQNQETFSVLYLPTLRGKKERNPLLDSDLLKINDVFKRNGITFCLKPHPASIGDWETNDNLTNFRVLDAAEDIYDFLVDTDLLITDYSSVHFDYLLTKKAVMFFPYDYEEYMNEDRGFCLSYDEYTPGKKVYTVEELIENIIEIKDGYEQYQRAYEKQYAFVNSQANEYQDYPNYKAITDIILGVKR